MSECNKVVEIIYPYQSETTLRGHVVNLIPGEKFRLISTVHDPWLYCAREFDQQDGFYLPITHVKVVDVDRVSSFRPDEESKKRRSEVGLAEKHILHIDAEGGSLRKRSPGFKLADPHRISKSIPGDLNFVHNITDIAAEYKALEQLNDESVPEAIMAVPRSQPKLSVNKNPGSESIMIDEGISSSIDSSSMNQSANYSSMGSSYAHDSSADDILVEKVTNCDVNGDKSADEREETRANGTETATNTNQDTQHESVRYENMYSCASLCRDRAPLPAPTDQPIRLLDDDWAEYRDAVGRTYFHHAPTQYSQWKPPRAMISAKEISVLSSSCETDDSISVHSTEDCDSQKAEETESKLDQVFDAVVVKPVRTLPHPISPPVPPEKPTSFSFDKDSQKSNSLTRSLTVTNKAYNLRTNNRNTVYEFSESLLKIPQMRNQDLQGSEENMRSTSVANCEQNNLKTGMLCKCKYMEAGRKIKKQWVPVFVYLTNAHLIFYKDKKSSERKGPHFDAPLGVCDLRGAEVDWSEKERTKRRHVIQLQLIDDTVYMFHLDNSPEIQSWFHLINEVISQLPRPDRYPAPPHYEQVLAQRKPSKKEPKNHVRNRSDAGIETDRPGSTRRDSWVGSKKRQVTVTQSVAMPSGVDSPDQMAKGTILEKLRKFFKHRPTVDQLKEKGIYKAEPVFGSNLIDICKREKTTVPMFLTAVTRLIEEKGLEVDGLYRVCGNLSQVQKLRCQVDQDKYTQLENEGDMSVLAGTLKLFFRELQEPLFPNSMTKNFLDSIKLQNPKQRLKSFQDNLLRLPPAHHDSLKHLLRHLTRVTEHAQKNRMQAHNLAIVFGPTLFCTGGEGAKRDENKNKKKGSKGATSASNSEPVQSNSHMAFNMIMQGQIVEYMLKEYNKLFASDSPNMVR